MSYAGWMRNYHAMGDDKLRNCLRELEGQYGDAYQRVQSKGGLLYEHVQEARREAKSRGWQVEGEAGSNAEPVSAQAVGILTEPMECSECGRVERHYEDDYICRHCRDAMSGAVAEDPQPEGPKVKFVNAEGPGPTIVLPGEDIDLAERLAKKLEAFNG